MVEYKNKKEQMDKFTALMVDDDPQIRKLVTQYFAEEGHSIYAYSHAGETLEALETISPDIVLLDLILPDDDGLHLLGEVRRKTDAPVIVISGKGESADKVVGLELGADDYIDKPFNLRELEARIKVVLRRAQGPAYAPRQGNKGQSVQQARESGPTDQAGHQGVYAFDGMKLDTATYEVTDAEGQTAGLTSGEFRLLLTLLEKPNQVLSREKLFELTRSDSYESFDRAIDMQIGRLRKKLGDNPRNPHIIKTIRGAGYMFIGQVRQVSKS